jgi:hypothetical protein
MSKKYEKRSLYMDYIVKSIHQFLNDPRRRITSVKRPDQKLRKFFKIFLLWKGRFQGNFFITLYFSVKLIYIVNTCAQIFFVSYLLNKNFWYFGVDFFIKLMSGQGWGTNSSKYFPKLVNISI